MKTATSRYLSPAPLCSISPIAIPACCQATPTPARAIGWMFAALSTVEPPIIDLQIAKLLENDKPWAEQRLPLVEERIRERLGQLSNRLADADWLDGEFSASDLMMASVLLRLGDSGILEEYPNISAYIARAEARPAYKRAFDAQLAVFIAASNG